MKLDRKHLAALREIRVGREERLSAIRSQHAQECARIEREVRAWSQQSEQLSQMAHRRSDERWRSLLSGRFDSAAIMVANLEDDADAHRVVAARRELAAARVQLDSARAELLQATRKHVQSLRRLETWNELMSTQARQQEKTKELKGEVEQEDARGARRAR